MDLLLGVQYAPCKFLPYLTSQINVNEFQVYFSIYGCVLSLICRSVFRVLEANKIIALWL